MFLRVQLIVSMLLAIKNFTFELARAHGRNNYILFSVKSAREKKMPAIQISISSLFLGQF